MFFAFAQPARAGGSGRCQGIGQDTDGDGKDDACDNDIDGDGMISWQEFSFWSHVSDLATWGWDPPQDTRKIAENTPSTETKDSVKISKQIENDAHRKITVPSGVLMTFFLKLRYVREED